MNLTYCLLCIFIMALATYLPRALPITLFRGQIKSAHLRAFLAFTPYAVLGALTFPDILYSAGDPASSAVGTAAALLLAYKKQSLVVVAVGAILAACLCRLLLL